MDTRYTIALARPGDCPVLASIEREASEMFRGWASDSLIDDVFEEHEFREAQAGGRLWVALADGVPIGFALVELLVSDLPHLEEVDVLPAHGRRGVGARLVRAVCDWAARADFECVTLTTFRDVPWNMPFYERLGFEEVPEMNLRPELREVVRAEAARGLEVERRVVMKRELRAGPQNAV